MDKPEDISQFFDFLQENPTPSVGSNLSSAEEESLVQEPSLESVPSDHPPPPPPNHNPLQTEPMNFTTEEVTDLFARRMSVTIANGNKRTVPNIPLPSIDCQPIALVPVEGRHRPSVIFRNAIFPLCDEAIECMEECGFSEIHSESPSPLP